ncbi:MAG: glycerol kinase GlpK [Pseudomonadota bacterium]
MAGHIIALDQGTTSTRAIVFDGEMRAIASAQEEFAQHYPRSGWVEHEAEDLWATSERTLKGALEKAGIAASDVAGIGITNQRETTVLWDRETGEALHRAIVWQDRRTADMCDRLRAEGQAETVQRATGLLLDPYFSGTKLAWLLDTVEGAREKAEAGKLAFGTVDCFLLWRLTGGKVHATDATNACRTLLYDVETGDWSPTMLDLLRIPRSLLPEIKDSAAEFGTTDLLGAPIPVLGIAGDQQAATVGQACFKPGMVKSTYGTGCFALMNTGTVPVRSSNRLLTTVAYQLDGVRTYALEGAIFVAGAAVQWLRDELKIVEEASETGALAAEADPNQDVILVPAFTGLGAPYWDARARGAMFGLTRGTGRAEIAKATLQSVGYQTRDLWEAMRADAEGTADLTAATLRVDGGMAASDWTMQFLADILGSPVERPPVLETTALGAAYLAGRQAGLYPDLEDFAAGWSVDARFEPAMEASDRDASYARWQDAIRRTLSDAGA